MTTFRVVAEIDQIVTKKVQLLVEAESSDLAEQKALDALHDYPKAVGVEGVHRIVTVKSNYWIPKSIDIKSTKEVKS